MKKFIDTPSNNVKEVGWLLYFQMSVKNFYFFKSTPPPPLSHFSYKNYGFGVRCWRWNFSTYLNKHWYHYSYPQAVFTPGMRNLGNTCYLNATIQALNAIPELHEALLTWGFFIGA